MGSEKKDRIKLYIVIALALVAGIVAFFRFIYQPGDSDHVPVSAATKPVQLEIPQLTTEQSERFRKYEPSVDEFSNANIRDIFQPEIRLEKLIPPTETKKSPAPTVFLKLKGTITGGENPIAVINGRFVRLGEKVEGYEIVSIGPNEVTLISNGHQKTLEVLTPLDEKRE